MKVRKCTVTKKNNVKESDDGWMCMNVKESDDGWMCMNVKESDDGWMCMNVKESDMDGCVWLPNYSGNKINVCNTYLETEILAI